MTAKTDSELRAERMSCAICLAVLRGDGKQHRRVCSCAEKKLALTFYIRGKNNNKMMRKHVRLPAVSVHLSCEWTPVFVSEFWKILGLLANPDELDSSRFSWCVTGTGQENSSWHLNQETWGLHEMPSLTQPRIWLKLNLSESYLCWD